MRFKTWPKKRPSENSDVMETKERWLHAHLSKTRQDFQGKTRQDLQSNTRAGFQSKASQDFQSQSRHEFQSKLRSPAERRERTDDQALYKKYVCRDGFIEKGHMGVPCDHGDSAICTKYGNYRMGRSVGNGRDLQPSMPGSDREPRSPRSRYARSQRSAYMHIDRSIPSFYDDSYDRAERAWAPPPSRMVDDAAQAGELEILVGYPKWLPPGVESVFLAADADDGTSDTSDRMHLRRGVGWSGSEGSFGGALLLACQAARRVSLHVMAEFLGEPPRAIGSTSITLPAWSTSRRHRIKLRAPLDIPIELVWVTSDGSIPLRGYADNVVPVAWSGRAPPPPRSRTPPAQRSPQHMPRSETRNFPNYSEYYAGPSGRSVAGRARSSSAERARHASPPWHAAPMPSRGAAWPVHREDHWTDDQDYEQFGGAEVYDVYPREAAEEGYYGDWAALDQGPPQPRRRGSPVRTARAYSTAPRLSQRASSARGYGHQPFY